MFLENYILSNKTLNDIFNNCIDGHCTTYGTTSVESLHLFQQCFYLMMKHDIEQCKIMNIKFKYFCFIKKKKN